MKIFIFIAYLLVASKVCVLDLILSFLSDIHSCLLIFYILSTF